MRSSQLLALISCFCLMLMACWDKDGPSGNTGGGEILTSGDAGTDEECIDGDGDGFGEGCGEDDCDDGDADITDECKGCGVPRTGCACEDGSEPRSCKPPPVEIDGETVICNDGTRFCRDGEWTACEPILGSRIN